MVSKIQVLGLDADDTLWENEIFFREAEEKFTQLLTTYTPKKQALELLFKIEIQNLERYGYGIKAFVLSMLETASEICNNNLPGHITAQILDIGKHMLEKPVHLLDNVKETLRKINKKYTIVLATKGDLLDQYKKLEKSGLSQYFHHIEIMPEKKTEDYKRLLDNICIEPEQFFMIGNSLKSDVLPVLKLGGYAMHIPYHTTWKYEIVTEKIQSPKFFQGKTIADLIDVIVEKRTNPT